jgi:hypothetical protein
MALPKSKLAMFDSMTHSLNMFSQAFASKPSSGAFFEIVHMEYLGKVGHVGYFIYVHIALVLFSEKTPLG